jgi:Fe-S-cluster-containing hydrogenase component 2
MKKLAITDKSLCMACKSCENACAQAFYKDVNYLDEDLSCLKIEGDAAKIKIFACVQCGKCAEACEAKAISKNAKGVWMIDKKLCTGCGKCHDACPWHLPVKSAAKPTASKCIACGICAKACPVDILYIKEDAA